MHLDKSKFFVTLVFEDFAEKCDFMVLVIVKLDTVYKSSGPFDYECFETIFLVEVSIHVLFHSFSSHPRILTFLVEFNLLRIHVLNRIFKLFKSESSLLNLAYSLNSVLNRLVPGWLLGSS